ncbi:MAG TPA: C40 family peptidase [Pedococcus sp.]
MTHHAPGRHRAPGRFNPLTELTGIVAQSAQPAVKTSAVLAASGGLVAAFAIPAHAAPADDAKAAPASAAAAPAAAVKAPAVAAPAQTAFGEIGFTATAKPKPRPAPAPAPEPAPERVEQAASRSVERAPLTSTKPAAGGVLGIAAQYEGLMYSYGGTSPETGFDCSGFTQYVFSQVGIDLPRTAEEQRQAVTPVSDPQPGDLVFFGAPAHHVGIYAGNGMMWDSPRSGKAVALRDIWSADVTYGRP